MSKHTPGPWEIDASDFNQEADTIFSISIWGIGDQGSRPIVASVSAFSLISEINGDTEIVTPGEPDDCALVAAKANARLIAAAPDLLDALRVLVDNPNGRTAVAFARQAISKATGEQP